MELELLAPSKNLEIGKAAIQHGADAVYIAGPQFGAREAAGNSLQDIEHLAKYAHQYYAKTYMVLNTILYENELEKARQLAIQAYEAGCDALIIQDMALLEMDLPPIPLFASTQTDNCTPEKIKFLQDVGFKRVILARETSLHEIEQIRKICDVDLEAFVHGALCVSYSGRCYISQALNGRSANRGSCGQICRLPFDVFTQDGRKIAHQEHLLSMKDLNLSSHIDSLAHAGISSFKIEGRLKDIGYVKNITAHYRTILDKLLQQDEHFQKASSGKVSLSFQPDPERSFSRGFTTYFMDGKQSGMCAKTAKASGKLLGTVQEVSDQYFTLNRKQNPNSQDLLANGDGICFFDQQKRLTGTRVNRVEDPKIYPLSMKDIVKGMTIFRNLDKVFEEQLSKTSATRKISMDLKIQITHQQIRFDLRDEDGVTQLAEFDHSADLATNQDRAYTTIQQQLQKTGDSDFIITITAIEGDIYFFNMATLNQWRRDLIAKQILIREKKRQDRVKQWKKPNEHLDVIYPYQQLNYTANIANSLARRFYSKHGVHQQEPAFEIDPQANVPLMYNRYCIKYELGICPSKQGGGIGGDLIMTYQNQKYRLVFDCKKCEMRILEG